MYDETNDEGTTLEDQVGEVREEEYEAEEAPRETIGDYDSYLGRLASEY